MKKNILNLIVAAAFIMSSGFIGDMPVAMADTQVAVTSSASNVSSNCLVLTHGLYIGASDWFFSGGDIEKLQNFLIARGYMSYSGSRGFYGPLTFLSVRNFQRDNGISAIGLVGPITRARIQEVSCNGGVVPPVIPPSSTAPAISSLAPSSGAVGITVTVYGSRFDSNTRVSFGGGIAIGPNVQVLSQNALTFTVPSQLLPACSYGPGIRCMIAGMNVEPGDYQISVNNSKGTSNALAFKVTSTTPPVSAPTISSLAPGNGSYGTVVTVGGSGFTRYNNSVNYAGRSGAVTGVESTDGQTLKFTIPATPCSSGMMCAQVVMEDGAYPISVTNSNGTSNAINFNLISGDAPLNKTVSLVIGQKNTIEKTFSIKPLRITEESRCPVGVYCIQAGRVVVETQIQSGNVMQNANLSFTGGTRDDSQSNIVVDGYIVRITNVTPNARQGGLSAGEYTITYQVTR